MNVAEYVIERFWDKVERGPTCWNWTASTVSFGYGCAWDGKRRWYAHRLSWTWTNGAIPEGVFVLHKCDNPRCVRPSHLYLGDKKQNALDRKNRSRHWKDRNPSAFKAHQVKISSHKGERNHAHKLTLEDVITIRASKDTNLQLAEAFGVHSCTIWRVRTGRKWAHL